MRSIVWQFKMDLSRQGSQMRKKQGMMPTDLKSLNVLVQDGRKGNVIAGLHERQSQNAIEFVNLGLLIHRIQKPLH